MGNRTIGVIRGVMLFNDDVAVLLHFSGNMWMCLRCCGRNTRGWCGVVRVRGGVMVEPANKHSCVGTDNATIDEYK